MIYSDWLQNQEIPISTSTTTNKVPTVSATATNHVQTGDTPTIYAQIQNTTGLDDGDKAEENQEDGLSIFGIPIPKIPFPILSFGLAPTTLSHGLLPIGKDI